MAKQFLAACILLNSAAAASTAAQKPNIVWFLTDDQDQMLGSSFPNVNGSTPMPRTKVNPLCASLFANDVLAAPSQARRSILQLHVQLCIILAVEWTVALWPLPHRQSMLHTLLTLLTTPAPTDFPPCRSGDASAEIMSTNTSVRTGT